MIRTKEELLAQIKSEKRQNKNLFTSFFVDASCIDNAVCREAQNIFCSFLNFVTKSKMTYFTLIFFLSRSMHTHSAVRARTNTTIQSTVLLQAMPTSM